MFFSAEARKPASTRNSVAGNASFFCVSLPLLCFSRQKPTGQQAQETVKLATQPGSKAARQPRSQAATQPGSQAARQPCRCSRRPWRQDLRASPGEASCWPEARLTLGTEVTRRAGGDRGEERGKGREGRQRKSKSTRDF